jgi:hypothetical protein
VLTSIIGFPEAGLSATGHVGTISSMGPPEAREASIDYCDFLVASRHRQRLPSIGAYANHGPPLSEGGRNWAIANSTEKARTRQLRGTPTRAFAARRCPEVGIWEMTPSRKIRLGVGIDEIRNEKRPRLLRTGRSGAPLCLAVPGGAARTVPAATSAAGARGMGTPARRIPAGAGIRWAPRRARTAVCPKHQAAITRPRHKTRFE